MHIHLDIFSINSAISMIIGLFLGFHFLTLKDENNKTNQYLGIFLILTSVSVLGSEFEEISDCSVLIQVLHPLSSPFIFAPLLLFYTFSLTNMSSEKVKKYRWIFLVPLIDAITTTTLLLSGIHIFEELVISIAIASVIFSSYIYFLILKEIKLHNNNILNLFSALDNKRLNWLKLLIIVNIGFLFIWILDDSLRLLIGDNSVSELLATLSHFATSITIIWISFSTLRQEKIFELKENPIDDIVVELNPKEDLLEKFKDVKLIIEKEKIFTIDTLSLSDLAYKLNLKPKELTQLLKECSDTNFYNFINTYRIEYFKTLITDSNFEHFSIEGLSQEVGFKSKSTFYSAFKNTEGITPNEYRLNQNIDI